MIERINSKDIESSLKRLNSVLKKIKPLSKQLVIADSGNMFAVDILTIAALNRAWGNAEGFKALINLQNLDAARSLLRIQIDTLIRYHAVWLVDEPHDFAAYVMNGQRIDKYKDQSGAKMRDAYLIEKLSQDYGWLGQVYKNLCNYVHFSGNHISSTVEILEDDRVTFSVSPINTYPEFSWTETVDCFSTSTLILFFYINGWIQTKNAQGHP